MADYLQPNDSVTVQQQRELFEVRTRMNQLPVNFGVETYCETNCGELLTNQHILCCSVLNNGRKHNYQFNHILNGNVHEKF